MLTSSLQSIQCTCFAVGNEFGLFKQRSLFFADLWSLKMTTAQYYCNHHIIYSFSKTLTDN